MNKTKRFDLLGAVQDKNSPLLVTLEGFKRTLMKHVGLDALPFTLTNNTTATLPEQRDIDNFPYGYFRMTNFELIKDRQSPKTLARHGINISIEDATNAAITKSYAFDVNLTLEMHYITNDVADLLRIISRISIVSSIDKFTFTANAESFGEWQVAVNLSDNSLTVPIAELEDPANPGSFDLVFNFIVKTKAGISKAVPKINNAGEVTTSIS